MAGSALFGFFGGFAGGVAHVLLCRKEQEGERGKDGYQESPHANMESFLILVYATTIPFQIAWWALIRPTTNAPWVSVEGWMVMFVLFVVLLPPVGGLYTLAWVFVMWVWDLTRRLAKFVHETLTGKWINNLF